MNWMLWSAAGSLAGAVGCFFKGAFALDWSGLPWMFLCAILFVVAGVFFFCGLLA
jgi:hypothetical protein